MKTYKPIMICTILSISGGLMDAYSYIYRGGVFANAQTGNILLLGVNLINGDIGMALQYLCPILCFIVGVIISLVINDKRIIVLLEAITLGIICFIPHTFNLVANSLISMACGMQLESFDEVYGYRIATTMCIGNLKSGTEHLYTFMHTGKKLMKLLLYYWIIISFIIGAIIGSIAIRYLQQNAILICTSLLLIVTILIDGKWNES